MDYTEINSKTWDTWVEQGIEWGVPISHEEFIKAKSGEWGVYLTPTKFVPKEWFLPFEGARLLGLASGGGQQMPLFSALGAKCTVFDYSERQLASEKAVAQREGYDITIVRGDMTKPLPFEDESFDLIFHPVSNVYIEDVYPVWRECFRVLRKGGVLLAGLDNGINFLFNDYEKLIVENKLPYNPLKDPSLYREEDGMQFSHTMEEQIGGQLKAGLRLTDLFEDYNRPYPDDRLHEVIPTFVATRAVKP
jgi:SAM-dependent methyltransferase